MVESKYKRVQIESLKGDVYYGLVNIGEKGRTSDFFDRKFKEGGNIQIVDATKNGSVGKTTFGLNAALIVEWKPTTSKENAA